MATEIEKTSPFSGTLSIRGLSNERELPKRCPTQFLADCDNPWVRAASLLFFRGGSMKKWKWRSDDHAHQLACFKEILSSWNLPHEHKAAVAGWMLSEMLLELPNAV